MSEKKYFIKDLHNSVGLTGTSVFALLAIDRRSTRAGKPFIDISLQDNSGEIGGKVWEDCLGNVEEVQVGDPVLVDFEVRSYQDRIELGIRSVKLAKDIEIEDLMLNTDGTDVDVLHKEFQKRLDSIREIDLRKLADRFFADESFFEQFSVAPAATSIHHNHPHGLLRHCLEMLSILDGVYTYYPDLNRDLVTVGVMLHDIGKIKENKVAVTGVASRTTEGLLVGHISLGLEMIHQRLPDDFPAHLKLQLDHLILSHQGKLEWGSPIIPSTREAMAVHLADSFSTYINIIDKYWRKGRDLAKGENEEKLNELFSEYSKHLGTSVYLGG